MNFLEKNLEDIIFETPNDVLQKRCLFINGFKKRQVRVGSRAVADLITADRQYDFTFEPFNEFTPNVFTTQGFKLVEFTIYELKQDKIGIGAILQSIRYAAAVKKHFYNRCFEFDTRIKIVLIGKTIESWEIKLLPDVLSNISIYTYKYDFDGLHFERVSKTFIDSQF